MILRAALLSAALFLPQFLAAQTPPWGQWQMGRSEFNIFAAWVMEGEPPREMVLATVRCAADVPYLNVSWLQGEPAQAEAQMQITVDGRPFWLNARYLYYAPEPGWTVELLPDVIAALGSGSVASVTVAGRGPADLRLNGSRAAISAALEGCGQGTGYHPDDVDYFAFVAPDANNWLRPVPRLPEPGETYEEIMAASEPGNLPAGDLPIAMDTLEARWHAICPSGVTLHDGAVRTADLDGDGRDDVLVNHGAIRCEGAEFLGDMQGLGVCGMHNCALDIYMSSLFRPGDNPVTIYTHMGVPPELRKQGEDMILTTYRQGGNCPFAQVCTADWAWDGTRLTVIATGQL